MNWTRRPFQGVWNIVRFNWHFYAMSLGLALGILAVAAALPVPYRYCTAILAALPVAPMLVSLLVSLYVYDLSGLYNLDWCGACASGGRIVNIHAGFDETSGLLHLKYSACELTVLDFYDSAMHTEVSIRPGPRRLPAVSRHQVDRHIGGSFTGRFDRHGIPDPGSPRNPPRRRANMSFKVCNEP